MPKALTRFLASGFGAGLIPLMPGTTGTLAAIPFALLLHRLSTPAALAVLVVLLPVCARICGEGAKLDGGGDPAWIVLDEIYGFLVATLFLEPHPESYAAAFFFFRLFDILKPPPVGWLDRSDAGGWSILLDDVAAGAMARGALLLLALAGFI